MARRKRIPFTAEAAGYKALQFLEKNPGKVYSLKQLSRRIRILNKKNRKLLHEGLFQLESNWKVIIHPDGTYEYNQDFKGREEAVKPPNPRRRRERDGKPTPDKPDIYEHEGKVDYVSSKSAYIISDEFENDVRVKASNLNGALDGDKVGFSLLKRSGKSTREEGTVQTVLERKRVEFVGTYEASRNFAFVVPDAKRMFFDIYIPQEKKGHAMNGDKVIARITQFPTGDKKPSGEIIKVLGQSGDNDVEMHAILAEYGLPYEFPEEIEQAAAAIPTEITKAEIKKRKDFRKVTTLTIDPFDAKDFDDAISLQVLPNGNYEVGVHIADVTHYVTPGSDIEKEAYERATSVYLVDRTVPMLPEVLSNNLCSLRPHEEKLVMSAVFELDKDANIKSQWFGKGVIYSDRRFTYEEAQERIETGEGDFSEDILTLDTLAKKLKVRRFDDGAISFETGEVKFKLAEDGTPLEVVQKVRKDAHKLVEEFMLLANKKVAQYVYDYKKGEENNTMVYRVHDDPNMERLESFAVFAGKFGHLVNLNKGISKALNALGKETEGKPEESILQSLAVRTMSKAKYTTDAKGHFGLAFEHYSHFTSPIRRYPDMMVHRLVMHYLNNGGALNKEDYEEKCKHSSEMEKLASDAERSSIKYKQVEYIQNMEEEEFDGIVSGVTEWGIYVEIVDTKCEGMVRLSSIEDDHYEYDADNFAIIGKNNKRIITFGDSLRVKVVGTSLRERTIDMILVDKEEEVTSK